MASNGLNNLSQSTQHLNEKQEMIYGDSIGACCWVETHLKKESFKPIDVFY